MIGIKKKGEKGFTITTEKSKKEKKNGNGNKKEVDN